MISHLLAARVLSGPLTIAGVVLAQLDGADLAATGVLVALPIEAQASIDLAGASISAAGALAVSAEFARALDGAGVSSAGSVRVAGQAAIALEGGAVSAAGALSIKGIALASLGGASLVAFSRITTLEMKAFFADQVGARSGVVPYAVSVEFGMAGGVLSSRALRPAVSDPKAAELPSRPGKTVSTATGPRSRIIALS